MTYRYNALDVIVGVGMCAIMFGALFFFIAASGTMFPLFVPDSSDRLTATSDEMVWLQPALGQAVVEQSLLQMRTDQMTAAAISEWNQAMLTHRRFLAVADHPLKGVFEQTRMVPMEHAARVQAVMGRYIVNFTRRAVKSGVLSSNKYVSDYNIAMIDKAEALGQRMDEEFASTWQAVVGRAIVASVQDASSRAMAIQEQLGSAIVHRTLVQTGLDDAWARNQYQMGSLMAALDRSGLSTDRQITIAAAQPVARVSSEPLTVETIVWPDIPMGYVIAAAFGLCAVFFGGLILAGSYREARALVEARRNASRWVYRMAS